MAVQLTYRYWDPKKQFWRHGRKFFDTPEDAEEFLTDHGFETLKHEIEPITAKGGTQ